MGAVMRLARRKKGPLPDVRNSDGARRGADARSVAIAPLVIWTVRHGGLGKEVMRVLAGNEKIFVFGWLGHGLVCLKQLRVCEVILKRSRNQSCFKAFRDFMQKVFRSASDVGKVRAKLVNGVGQFKLVVRVRVFHADRGTEFRAQDDDGGDVSL